MATRNRTRPNGRGVRSGFWSIECPPPGFHPRTERIPETWRAAFFGVGRDRHCWEVLLRDTPTPAVLCELAKEGDPKQDREALMSRDVWVQVCDTCTAIHPNRVLRLYVGPGRLVGYVVVMRARWGA